MPLGRIVSSCAAATAAAGCAVLALAMSQGGGSQPTAKDSPSVTRPPTLIQATAPAPVAPLVTGPTPTTHPATTSPRATPTAPKSTSTAPSTSHAAARTTAPPPPARSRATQPSQPSQPTSSSKAPAPKHGVSLPLGYTTGSATKVITVVAHSTGSTTATLQAWTKAPGGGWLRHGSSVTAHIGSAGMTAHPSESLSATPMGSYTLTQAFGYKSDPGTALPYFKTSMADWWISQSGNLYNTHQSCPPKCSDFTQGSPNEHLAAETPYYNYAVVIDYNTPNAPGGVRQGAGSAFFLHVHPSGTGATAGCVAIPQDRLVSLMQWLTPGAHPRILIGVG